MPLKKGLVSNKVSDDQLTKMVNEASEDAFSLINKVEDLKHKIKGVKTIHNSRFANKVVSMFLEDSK
jgi:Txe/YoeB family toxin of Txe-Axe toxin-antitoxin module